MDFLLICLAGAAGTGARYLLASWIASVAGIWLPFGTLLVNALGSFLIGLIAMWAMQPGVMSETLRMALTIGFLGGFTTYSSFNFETLHLFQTGHPLKAILNVLLMLSVCFLFGYLGSLAGTKLGTE